MSRSKIAMMFALALSGLPAEAQSPSLGELKASLDGKWTLGPSQADNKWSCAEAPIVVTVSVDFKRSQTIAMFENWPLNGKDTVFNLSPVVSVMKVADRAGEAAPIALGMTPDAPGHPRLTRETRYLRKAAEDVFVWGLMNPQDYRPMVFIRCSGDQ